MCLGPSATAGHNHPFAALHAAIDSARLSWLRSNPGVVPADGGHADDTAGLQLQQCTQPTSACGRTPSSTPAARRPAASTAQPARVRAPGQPRSPPAGRAAGASGGRSPAGPRVQGLHRSAAVDVAACQQVHPTPWRCTAAAGSHTAAVPCLRLYLDCLSLQALHTDTILRRHLAQTSQRRSKSQQ